MRVFLQTVHEVGFVEQATCHLHSLEAVTKHLVYLVACNQAAHVDELHVGQSLTELQGILQEECFLVRHGLGHRLPHKRLATTDAILEQGVCHVVRHRCQRQFAAHDIHRRCTHQSAAQHDGMDAKLLQPTSNGDAVPLQRDTVLQAVAHVHLDYHSHIVLGSLHDFLNAHAHEAHTVLQRTAELILAVVEEGIQELVNQVAVSAMNLHFVEASLASQVDSTAELLGQLGQFVLTQTAHDGRTVEVETVAGSHRNAAANVLMAHVAAMTQLDACRSTFLVYAVCQVAKTGKYLRLHHQLAVKAQAALRYSSVCHSRHSHTTASHTRVVVVEHLAGFVPRTHALESRTSDGAVPQSQRPNMSLFEYLVHS